MMYWQDLLQDLATRLRSNLLPEMVQELFSLETGWFNVLAKLEKQEFEQDVHISWERGSIYFDTVKIYLSGAHRKGKQGQAGLAVSQTVKHY